VPARPRAEKNINVEIATLGPPELPKLLSKFRQSYRGLRIVPGEAHDHTDAPHPLALLRAGRKRPRNCRAAEQGDELAPPHVQPQGSPNC
jgi:hypothetical protein